MSLQYDLEGQRQAYARWAPFYDYVYVKLLADSHRRTAAAAAGAGRDILEVGAGTGLVLAYYPPESRVFAVDLSEEMLRKAVDKVRRKPLRHVKLISVMDGCRLAFGDARFDAVTLPFVITLVPDPERALTECARVLKPGGEIVIATKFGRDEGPQARVEEWLAPLMRKIGWSSAFKTSRVLGWAEARGDIEFLGLEPLFPAGFFKLMRLRKRS
jgi:phosphatidylethanolamine/phosphatidyl-N-methylethanolamine N-methyltransferase